MLIRTRHCVALVLLLVSLASPAWAASSSPHPGDTTQSSPSPTLDTGRNAALPPTPLSAPNADNHGADFGAQAASIVHNPWNCFVQADYPHLSSHIPGTINVVGKTAGCSQPQPSLFVQIELQRRRVVWPFYWWETVQWGQSSLHQLLFHKGQRSSL